MKLNVTPAEFLDLQEACYLFESGAWTEGDWVAYVRRFGCHVFQSYTVVVRHDVPAVPWYSLGVERIEEE